MAVRDGCIRKGKSELHPPIFSLFLPDEDGHENDDENDNFFAFVNNVLKSKQSPGHPDS